MQLMPFRLHSNAMDLILIINSIKIQAKLLIYPLDFKIRFAEIEKYRCNDSK